MRIGIILFLVGLMVGCASTGGPLKGELPGGEKVYISNSPMEGSEAFRNYQKSSKREVDKLRYLFKRVTAEKEYIYIRDGDQYGWLEVYRAGMWLMRNRYKSDMSAQDFLKAQVWRSDITGKPHLVQFPDGPIPEAYYILLNELALLESLS